MKYISYNGVLRHETNEIADVLIRKGWTHTPPPELQNGQRHDWINGEWVVSNNVTSKINQISLRQFRMALKRVGLFYKIDELKNSPYLNQTQKDDLTEFLEYSNMIERNHPLIISFAAMLGVTSEQIDQVFQLADTL